MIDPPLPNAPSDKPTNPARTMATVCPSTISIIPEVESGQSTTFLCNILRTTRKRGLHE